MALGSNPLASVPLAAQQAAEAAAGTDEYGIIRHQSRNKLAPAGSWYFEGDVSLPFSHMPPRLTGWPFTVSVWVRYRSGTPVGYRPGVSMADSVAVSQDGSLMVGLNGTKAALYYEGTGAEGYIVGQSTSALTANQWYNVTAVFRSDTVKDLYLDGVFQTTAAQGTGGAGVSWNTSNNNVEIGALNDNIGDRTFFGRTSIPAYGDVAAPAIWSGELTDNEIFRLGRGEYPSDIRGDKLIWLVDQNLIEVVSGRLLTKIGGGPTKSKPPPRLSEPSAGRGYVGTLVTTTPGSETYERDVSETLSLNESKSNVATMAAAIAEGLTYSEIVDGVFVSADTITEAVTLSESIASVIVGDIYDDAIVEAFTLTEVNAAAVARVGDITETVDLAESLSVPTLIAVGDISESVTISDTLTIEFIAVGAIDESITISETTLGALLLDMDISEAIEVTPTFVSAFGSRSARTISATATLSDDIAMTAILSDDISMTATLVEA